MSLIRALATIALFGVVLLAQKPKVWTGAEVMRIHRSAILIDTHNDVTSDTVRGLDLGLRRAEGHTDIPRMKQGGMAAQFFAAYVSAGAIATGTAARDALRMIDTIRTDIAARHPESFFLATTAAQIERAPKSGRMAALIGIEGGHAIENDLRLLRAYYDLGVRYMTLTHSADLDWAGSSGATTNKGLSDFGRQVIAEMNRVGMMIDVAHVSDRTFWHVIETSKAPVFSSHSSCRAISNIPRNMTDDMIRAVAKSGGVVQINFGCEFLSQQSADTSAWTNPAVAKGAADATASISGPVQRRAAAEKWAAERMQQATIDDVFAHIDHVRRVAGIGHVGLGSDFDGVTCAPKGLEDVSQWPNLTRKLLEHGYTPAEIRQVYGGNFLRFMKAVERAASASSRRPFSK